MKLFYLFDLFRTEEFSRPQTSSLVWHFRLGHSSFDVVSRVVKHNHLPFSCNDFNKNVVCTSCQLGKSKRQPFH